MANTWVMVYIAWSEASVVHFFSQCIMGYIQNTNLVKVTLTWHLDTRLLVHYAREGF